MSFLDGYTVAPMEVVAITTRSIDGKNVTIYELEVDKTIARNLFAGLDPTSTVAFKKVELVSKLPIPGLKLGDYYVLSLTSYEKPQYPPSDFQSLADALGNLGAKLRAAVDARNASAGMGEEDLGRMHRRVRENLELVNISLPHRVTSSWNRRQLQEVSGWAWQQYLLASDNEFSDDELRPMPQCLADAMVPTPKTEVDEQLEALLDEELVAQGVSPDIVAGPRMSWTHPCCDTCWTNVLDRTEMPVRSTPDERAMEICSWCGDHTDSGIYVRADPSTVPHPALKED